MKRLLLILTIILTCTTYSFASHLISAEITYTHVTGNDYEISLTLYRDCSGIALTASENVSFQSTSCSQMFTTSLPLVITNGVSQVCTGTSSCVGGTLPGVEQNIYRGIVTLPSCVDWNMSWNSCCRNPSITNLSNPSSQSIYIQNTLNNTIGVNNNSVQYSNLPIPFLSTNNLAVFNHGVTEADGDSLYFTLTNSLTGSTPPGTPINFNTGLSLNQPLATSSGFNFNQTTGEMCFTPSTAQVAVISTLIEEYRAGVLIASQIREIQANINTSTNQYPNTGNSPSCGNTATMNITSSSPSVTQIDGNSISMCPGDNFCFNISPIDPDGNNIEITSNITTSIPGATFSVTNNNTPNPVATICYSSSISDYGMKNFTVNLSDDACPIPGKQYFAYDINIGAGVYAGIDQTICESESAQFNATGGTTYTWFDASTNLQIPVGPEFSCNPCSNPIASPVISTNYYVSSPSTSCGPSDSITLTVIPSITTTETISICQGDSVLLSGIYQSTAGTYYDTLQSNLGCDSILASNITVANYLANYTYSDNGNANFSFINSSTGAYVFSDWSFGDGNTSSLSNPSHTFTTNGVYTVVLAITDSLNSCVQYFIDTITVTNSIGSLQCNAGFVLYPDTLTTNILAINNSTGNNLNYLWDFGDGNTSTLQNPSHTYAGVGPYNLCVSIDDGNGCTDTYCDSATVTGVAFKSGGFTINVISDPASTSIKENSTTEITIHPNPNNGIFTIEKLTNSSSETQIKVYDITSKVILHKVLPIHKNKVELDIQQYKKGLYFIQITSDKGTITKRIIKN